MVSDDRKRPVRWRRRGRRRKTTAGVTRSGIGRIYKVVGKGKVVSRICMYGHFSPKPAHNDARTGMRQTRHSHANPRPASNLEFPLESEVMAGWPG